jgi:hypothetical protein
LDAYPEVENILLEMSSGFAKLKNPILRRTVAIVANLRQAAELGKVPLGKLINLLRQAVGQDEWWENISEDSNKKAGIPTWVSAGKINKSIDARSMLDAGEQPVTLVLKELSLLPEGKLVELITPFLPTPLIDLAKKKDFCAGQKRKLKRFLKPILPT